MIIRNANLKDLGTVAIIHKECFKNSFSTVLGKKNRLLEKLYYEYFVINPELFLIAEDDENNAIGFCMGYYCESNAFQKSFLKHNFLSIFFRMLFLLLSFNSQAWKKIVSIFKKKNVKYLSTNTGNLHLKDCGDLLSICVLPQNRGDGSATKLIKEYENIMVKKGRSACMLTVENNNERGIAFYKKNGYVPFKSINNHETTMIHLLDE